MSALADVRDLFTRNLRTSGIYIAFVAIVVLFAILTDGMLLQPGNVTNLVLQYSYVLILALGMIIVIVAGHIDLSVGSVVALTGAVSAIVVIREGQPWWMGLLAALGVGLLVGVWHGFWVAYVGIPAFIVTLAGMLLFRGLTLRVLDNISLSPFPREYQHVANGFLNGLLGGQGYDVFTLVIGAIAVAGFAWSQWRSRAGRVAYRQPVEALPLFVVKLLLVALVVMAFAWQLAHSRGLPIVLIILAVLILTYQVLTTRTVFGPARLRDRRQPVGRPALGGEGQAGQLLDLREHGLPRRRGGSGVLVPVQRRPAGGRQHVRARRHRRLLHRWRLDRRRCGARDRGHGRRSGHGRHVERHVDHGRRPVDAADHQRSGAAARRRLRHLQQAAGRCDPLTAPAPR